MRIVCRHALLHGRSRHIMWASLTAGGQDYNIRSVVLNIQVSLVQTRTAFCHFIQIRTADPHRILSGPGFKSVQSTNECHACMSYVGQRQRSASGVSLQILKIQRAHSKSAGSIYKRRLSPNYSMMQRNEILFWK